MTNALAQINNYITVFHPQQSGKKVTFYVTEKEMAFLRSEAGDDLAKHDILDKHYEVYERFSDGDEKETAYEKGRPNPPLNRADRRRLRFGKTPKSVVSEKRF
jgi:hypothetical protein